jgi:glutamate--cysteine ligase
MVVQPHGAASGSVVTEPLELHALEHARTHIVDAALAPSTIGAVGLELEMHLVDLADPIRRVPWRRLTDVIDGLPDLPYESAVTVEPGGQVELSTPPMPDVSAAVAALGCDRGVLGRAFGEQDMGLVAVGADPARPVERLSPKARYAEMERHFVCTGNGEAGRAMMCSTAALQLNLEAGPASAWSTRVSRMHRIGPVLVAISACSPWLAGRTSGWRSMRQQVWGEIDQARCGPLLGGEHPDEEWAAYALAAPVMLVRDAVNDDAAALTERVSFEEWVLGDPRPGRAPTVDDLDYHLSTLFPPLRPRGFLELRCLDAVPDRWWPALAGLAVTLLDDPIAADRADEACAGIDGCWSQAAQRGLGDPEIARAATICVELAAERAPVELKADIEEYAELVVAGHSPGDEVRALAEREGPLAVLRAEAIRAAEAYA